MTTTIAIKADRAFSLIELLVVTAILGMLAALLLSALSASRGNAKRTVCLNNLKQVNLGIHMYCDDSNDNPPAAKFPSVAYKNLMKSYVVLNGRSSPQDRIFACPADTFFYYDLPNRGGLSFTNAPQHEYSHWDYSSYWFNGQNNDIRLSLPKLGIAGLKFTSIKDPVKTLLVAESPAFLPYSWHQPRLNQGPMFNNAKDMASFVDGHASYIEMFCELGVESCCYNPPAGYDYKWSGD